MTLDDLLNEKVRVDCRMCQGHSLPGRTRGEIGYCPTCGGAGTVEKSQYALLDDAERVEVLETEVQQRRAECIRLREKLAAERERCARIAETECDVYGIGARIARKIREGDAPNAT